MNPRARRRSGGFTLIEVMAVAVLTAIVITAAVTSFLQLTRAQNVATERTRLARQADALLTRVARDLATAALLVREEAVDPLSHPWVFVAERRLPVAGADHVRFARWGRERRGTDPHESDLETVAYVLRQGDFEGGYELYRWSSSQLGESLDKSFPDDPADGALLVADNIADFGLRFLSETGAWQEEWDSSNLEDTQILPIAAEIAVAFESGEEGAEPVPLVRQVWMPVRPVDIEKARKEAAAAEDGDEEDENKCVTVRECLERDPVAFEAVTKDPGAKATLESLGDRCVEDFDGVFEVDISRCL